MTDLHRENQVIEAIAQCLADELSDRARVFTHRRRTLAQEIGDTPAISVDFGSDDEAADSEQTLDGFTNDADIGITVLAMARTEPELMERIGALRREIHVALRANRRLGTDWVISLLPTRAEEPDVSADNEMIIGVRTFTWVVRYRHSTNDPAN